DLARAKQPDLMITDVLMPVMDGYELVRQLRADPATRRILVVFHTGHFGEPEGRNLAISAGVFEVLEKPASTEAILGLVERALASAAQGETPQVKLLTST